MVNNLTNLTGTSTIYGLVEYSNQVSTGIIGMGFVISTFIILVMVFLRKDLNIQKSILVSSFICFIFSLMLRNIELLEVIFVIDFAVMTVLAGLWVYFTR